MTSSEAVAVIVLLFKEIVAECAPCVYWKHIMSIENKANLQLDPKGIQVSPCQVAHIFMLTVLRENL